MSKQKFSDLEEYVTIICREHGDYKIKARNHIGENEEEIAYGCPECCGFIEGVHVTIH